MKPVQLAGIVISRGYVFGGRVNELAPNLLLAPSNPAGYAGYSRRGEERNASSIIWIKNFMQMQYL